MKNKIILSPAIALLSCTILIGCSGTNDKHIEETGGHVILDRQSGQIILPLDNYDFYGRLSNMATFNKAKNVWLKKCLNKVGYTLKLSAEKLSETEPPEERTYGLWLPDRAKKYGFDFPPQSKDERFMNEKLEHDSAWAEEFDNCQNKLQETKTSFLRVDQAYNSSLASKLASESFEQVLSDDRWREIRTGWKDCLSDSGLTPPRNDTSFVSEEAEELLDSGSNLNSDELNRIAIIESTCNNQVELTERLGNLEGSIQENIIRDNIEALSNEKNEIETELSLVDEYIEKNLK